MKKLITIFLLLVSTISFAQTKQVKVGVDSAVVKTPYSARQDSIALSIQTDSANKWRNTVTGIGSYRNISVGALNNLNKKTGLIDVAPYDDILTTAATFTTGTTSFECINVSQQYRIRQPGTITQLSIYLQTLTNLTGFYLRVWRYNGSTYNLVGESNNIIASLTGGTTSTVNLTTAISGVQQGDYYGYRTTQSGTWAGTTANFTIPNSMNYYEGNAVPWVSGVNVGSKSNYNAMIPITLRMSPPTVVGIGNSIMQGIPNNTAFTQTVSNNFDTATYWLNIVANRFNWTYQNMGHGSDTTGAIRARFQKDVVDKKPRIVVMEGGTNDFISGYPNATIIANIQWYFNLAVTNNITPIVIPIPPCNAASNAQMLNRDIINATMKTYVETNGGIWIKDLDDSLGQFRTGGAAGNKWDYKTGYNTDGYHMNATGNAAFARTVITSLLKASIASDPSAVADFTSVNTGVLFPRVTTAQMNSIINPANGLLVTNTDSLNRVFIYNGTTWVGLVFTNEVGTIAVSTKTTNYTITTSDNVILADATGGAFNVTLPTAVGTTKEYSVKRINSGANNVTVNTTSSQTIDGALTQSLFVQYQSLNFVSNGANWFIK